jgi:hypothetical protein
MADRSTPSRPRMIRQRNGPAEVADWLSWGRSTVVPSRCIRWQVRGRCFTWNVGGHNRVSETALPRQRRSAPRPGPAGRAATGRAALDHHQGRHGRFAERTPGTSVRLPAAQYPADATFSDEYDPRITALEYEGGLHGPPRLVFLVLLPVGGFSRMFHVEQWPAPSPRPLSPHRQAPRPGSRYNQPMTRAGPPYASPV